MPEPDQLEAVVESEEAIQVFHWRVRAFLDGGFTIRQAKVLAACQVDSHAAERLLEAGCPVDVAFDLLS